MIIVSKTWNTKNFSETQFMVHRTKWVFSQDFMYKVDPFNLYIIENYIKRTIGGGGGGGVYTTS